MTFSYSDMYLHEAVYLFDAHGDITVCDADAKAGHVVAEDEE
jgi:hypothetical protein